MTQMLYDHLWVDIMLLEAGACFFLDPLKAHLRQQDSTALKGVKAPEYRMEGGDWKRASVLPKTSSPHKGTGHYHA